MELTQDLRLDTVTGRTTLQITVKVDDTDVPFMGAALVGVMGKEASIQFCDTEEFRTWVRRLVRDLDWLEECAAHDASERDLSEGARLMDIT